ncbi:MAG: ATP-binding protein [Lachnospiraceae bacterium]|nr:ATP-binding protein [Lachnospiraceae bacterium]
MSCKIDAAYMKNYGILGDFQCDQFSNINLIIGENGTGKTYLLKSLYSMIRSLEEYKRGDNIKPFIDVLSEKLRWTFQVDKLGDMVTRSASESLKFDLKLGNVMANYQLSQSASNKVGSAIYPDTGKNGNSVYIPAKEVLSLFSIILKSREIDQVFGFDDTYYDLAKALRIAPSRGKNYSAFANSRKIVSDVINGKVDYDESSGKWYYKNKKNQKFSIGATSEGVKKIAIMDRLLANGYLDHDSVIFIDEIEAALHPDAVCQYLDMIDRIAREMDIQFFITSHSYFVIKKLFLVAYKRADYVMCISLDRDRKMQICDLHDGMPNNSIIDASIRLYEEEIEEVL